VSDPSPAVLGCQGAAGQRSLGAGFAIHDPRGETIDEIAHCFWLKAVCLFMNMDKTIGGDLEKGLAQMKSVVEAAGDKKARTRN
jgi:hypothetical protein